MSRKVFPFLFVLIFIISQTGCLYGNIVDNKYTTTGVGNLTPVKSLTYYVGSPTYTWAGGYFANLTTNYLNLFNTNTNISRDGAGNMIFTDTVSGTKTLADLTVGSGGNVTGSGTNTYITQWTSSSTVGNSPMSYSAGAFNFGGMAVSNVSTIDGVDVSTTVTGSGAPTRLAYFDGVQSIGDTNIYFDVPQGYYGIGTTTPDTMLQIHDGSGANQLQLSYTDGSIYTNITSNHMGYLLLNPTGDRAVLSGNLSMNTHYINDVVNPSLAQDAATKNYVDTAVAGVGGGNVTTNGLTSGYIPVASSSTRIVNSAITSNGTLTIMPIVTESELCPTIAVANWTAGAGWTIGAGTLTRVPSAVTTAYPTAAIVPSTSRLYKLEFTISSWTAGHVVVSFGGVNSTAIQGDQIVHLYVSPATTDNLIFIPNATFSGVISAVSIKAFSGGELEVDGDIIFYDERGHIDSLANMSRHYNEMSTDTLLDKSQSTLSCSGGVLTYTLIAVYGHGGWNFKGVVYPINVSSASVSLIPGTDSVPVANYVYVKLVNNVPTLSVSSIDPSGDNCIMVAEFIVGAVSGSSYTLYGYNRARTEVDSFVKRVIGRFENSGSLYESGSLPTVNTTAISVASGGKWYQGIFEMTAANTVVAPTSFYYMFNNGTYVQATSLASMYWYADGTLLGSNERQNIVWGIVPTTTTASGTLPTTVKLVAVLQSKPSSVYISAATAEQDVYEATNYYPPDAQLKEVFVPIARTILRPSTSLFEVFGSGAYYKDLRGKVTSGGSAPTVDTTIKYTVQVVSAVEATPIDSQTVYWGGFSVAPSTTANRWRVYIPKGGLIKTVYIYSYSDTAGSNENWSMYVRLNNTTDTLVQTLGTSANDRVWSNSALNIVVAAGDYIEIKEVQPAWGTNPANVTRTGVIYIE